MPSPPREAALPLTIRPAQADADFVEVRALFREYARSLPVNLSYQGFAEEVAKLPGDYASPAGVLFLALLGQRHVGCVGVRPLDERVCEMKRLYVRPEGRGRGIGRALAQAAIEFGRAAGYDALRLDTLPSMATARSLYRELGFREVTPYRFSPVPGTAFMERGLGREERRT